MRPQQDFAGRGILGSSNLPEDLEPTGLGQSPRDLRELALADSPGPRGRHSTKLSLDMIPLTRI